MFKKTMVLFLGLVFILSLCPAYGVFAAAKTDSQILETYEGTTYTEFENVGGSPTSITTEVVSDGDNKALKFTTTANNNRLGFIAEGATAESFTELSYDVQLQKAPTTVQTSTDYGATFTEAADGTPFIHIGGGSHDSYPKNMGMMKKENKYYFAFDTTEICEMSVGAWYHVKAYKSGTTGNLFVSLYDAEGTHLYSTNTGAWTDSVKLNVIGTPLYTKSDAEFLIDNVIYNSYSAATYGPSLIGSSIANGATQVATGTKSVLVELDQPLSTQAATLTSESGTAITCTITTDSANRKYIVSWSDTLSAETTYTLNLEGSKNAQSIPVDSTGVITFITAAPSIEDDVVRDSFETASYFDATYKLYGNGSASGTSDFVSHLYWNIGGVTQTEGYTGNGAKIALSNEALAVLQSRYARTATEDVSYVVNFRMKIKDAPVTAPGEEGALYSGGNNIAFGVSAGLGWSSGNSSKNTVAYIALDEYTGKHYIGQYLSPYNVDSDAGRKGYYYTEDKWYNATWVLSADSQRFVLTDGDGNLCFDATEQDAYTEAYHFNFAEMIKANTDKNIGAEVTLDDLAIWTVDKTKTSHKLKIESITGTELDKDIDKILITYNQPVAVTPEMIDIYEGDDCITLTGKQAAITYPGFNSIALAVSSLDYVSSYTLDLGGVTSAGGAAMADTTATHSFTTKADTRYDVSIIGDFGGVDLSGGTLTEVTLTADLHNNTVDEIQTVLFAAVYDDDDKLLGVEKSDTVVLTAGMNQDVTVVFTEDYTDAAKVKLFTWNSLSELKPLALAKEMTAR